MKTKRLRPYKGLLKNKKTADFLREALNAPIGSTKRQQAKKMLAIVRKTYDGKGGNGPVIQQPPVQFMPPKRSYNPRMFLPRAPKVKIPIGKKIPSLPNQYDGKGGFMSPAQTGMAATLSQVPGIGPLATAGAAMYGASQLPNKIGSFFEQPKPELPKAPTFSFPKLDSLRQRAEEASQTPIPAGFSIKPNIKSPVTQSSDETLTPPDWGDDATVFGEVTPGSTITSSSFPNLQSAIEGGKGSTQFAMDTMKETGGSLQDRYDELAGALRKSLDVDSIESRLLQRIGNRQPLEQDLTDYIRGRDEFLNETDGMLERLKATASKIDTSDPRNRKAIADHANYLFTLRGRQNKRYIETLKMSLDSYDAETESLATLYSTKMDEYKTRLSTGTQILVSEYENMMTGLKEMYELAASGGNSVEHQIKLAELQKTQYQAIKEGLEVQKLQGGSTGESDPSKIAQAFKTMGYIDDNGRLIPNTFMANIGAYDGMTTAKMIVDSNARALTMPDSNKQMITVEDAKKTAASAITNLDMLYQEQKIDSQSYTAFKDTIRRNFGTALAQRLAGSAPAIQNALSTIERGTAWFGYTPPTEERLLSGVTDTATQDVIKFLYQNFKGGFTDNPKAFVDAFSKDSSGQPLDATTILSNVLSQYATSLQPVPVAGSSGFNSVAGDTNLASRIANTIKTIESNGDYRAVGASGERGAYQFMRSSWQEWAGKYLGNPNAPLTPQNQDTVAIARINDLLAQGYSAEEVALIWNGGSPTIKKGVNQFGVAYDTGKYLNNFVNNFS